MKIVLHAGALKTGSTSIQFALSQTRKQLAEVGIFYPKLSHIVPNQHWPLAFVSDVLPKGQFLHDRMSQDGRADFRRVIFAELHRCILDAQEVNGVLLLSTMVCRLRA